MYMNAYNNDLIPREGFLSLNNLPTVVCCRWLADKSNNSSIETCRSVIDTNISPVEAQKYTIDMPILRGSTSLAIVTPRGHFSCYLFIYLIPFTVRRFTNEIAGRGAIFVKIYHRRNLGEKS